jgi:hypothetical protein
MRALATVVLPCAAVVLGLTTTARADPLHSCTDSHERAQILRKKDKLLEARAELQICTAPGCPPLIVSDCTEWVADLGASIPSIVPVATGESGENLVDVHLTIDGAPLGHVLDGSALEVDPGPHRLAFSREGYEASELTVLVATGERNKRIAAVLKALGTAMSAAPPVSSSSRSTLAWAGLGTAGVGVAALALAGVFGGIAAAKQSDAGCPLNVCRPGGNPTELRTAVDDGNVSTALFITGGVLAAAGLTTFLLAPRPGATRTLVGLTPVWMRSGGGVAVRFDVQ